MSDSTKHGKLTGILSGDDECFCLDVTEEEYRRVMGEEKYQEQLAYMKTRQNSFPRLPPLPWRIYPQDLFGYGEKK